MLNRALARFGRMRNARGALWLALALSAIVLAAGLTWSVMRLAGEHIGLASAPVSVVRRLAPGPGVPSAGRREHDVTRTITETVTVSRTVTVPASATLTQNDTGSASVPSRAGSTPAAATTTTSPAVTITPPSFTRTTSDRSDGARERAGSGGGRDD